MKDATVTLKEVGHWEVIRARLPWQAWFVVSAGAILTLAGANSLLDAFGKSQVLNLQDPILALPFSKIVALVGLAELFVGWLCLFTRKQFLALGLVGWLALSFLVYRGGLWTMGWHHPWIFVGGLANLFNISPLFADGVLFLIALYLLAGSFFLLLLPHTAEVAPQKPAGFVKISCPACGGHIEFPVRALGRKIACPHCKMDFTLAEPTMP